MRTTQHVETYEDAYVTIGNQRNGRGPTLILIENGSCSGNSFLYTNQLRVSNDEHHLLCQSILRWSMAAKFISSQYYTCTWGGHYQTPKQWKSVCKMTEDEVYVIGLPTFRVSGEELLMSPWDTIEGKLTAVKLCRRRGVCMVTSWSSGRKIVCVVTSWSSGRQISSLGCTADYSKSVHRYDQWLLTWRIVSVCTVTSFISFRASTTLFSCEWTRLA